MQTAPSRGGLFLAAVLAAAPAFAQDAQQTFEELFGRKIRAAQATRDTRDDLALAAELLETSGKIVDQTELLVLLARGIYDLATKDLAGYPTALDATRLLAAQGGDYIAEASSRALRVHELRYEKSRGLARTDAGHQLVLALDLDADFHLAVNAEPDARKAYHRALSVANAINSPDREVIQDKLTGLAQRNALFRRLSAATLKLKAKPQDPVVSREVLELCLLEIDEPQHLQPLLPQLAESSREIARLADTPAMQLDEAAAMKLADWYAGNIRGDATARIALCQRARAAYLRFLNIHTTEDLDRARATVKLDAIDKQLATLAAEGARARPRLAAPILIGLAAHWNFDDAKGVSFRDSVSENAATGQSYDAATRKNRQHAPKLVKDHAPTRHKNVAAAAFDGVDDHLIVPDSPTTDLLQEFTISVWVKTSGVGKEMRLLDRNFVTSYALHISAAGIPIFLVGSTGDASFPKPITDGQWHHIAAIYDSMQRKIFVDGQPGASIPGGKLPLVDSANPMHIGAALPAASGNCYQGLLDDLRVYRRALTDSEVQMLAERGR